MFLHDKSACHCKHSIRTVSSTNDFKLMIVHNRFYPSTAKAIADKIIADELSDVKYDEDEAKTWSLSISDKIREAVTGNDEHVDWL